MPELEQEKIFKYLTAILSLFVVVLLVREIFFTSDALVMPDISFPIVEINIRTEIFDEFNVGDLTPFQTIALPKIIGRDKPFEPYSIAEYNVALKALYATSTATTTEDTATTTIFTITTTEEIATTTEDMATTTEDTE